MSERRVRPGSFLEQVARVRRPRVAVVRALRMGDFLTAVPALRALRTALPDAEVTYVGLPLARPLAERFPGYIDRFLEFPGFPGVAEPRWSPERLPALTAFIQEAQAYRYDLALQMHGSGVFSNPFTLLLGAARTAGHRRGSDDHFGLDFGPEYPTGTYEVDVNLGLVTAMGAPDTGRRLEFPVSADDEAAALALLPDAWLREGRPLVGLHPGAKTTARRWPARFFAAAADILVAGLGAGVVITGGPEEADACRRVAAAMRSPACNLAGRTSLGALAGLLKIMDSFISNDTGPAHLAAAIGTPGVTLFGPSSPHLWVAPEMEHRLALYRPVPCSPCAYDECPVPGHPCLENLRPDAVVAHVRRLMSAGPLPERGAPRS